MLESESVADPLDIARGSGREENDNMLVQLPARLSVRYDGEDRDNEDCEENDTAKVGGECMRCGGRWVYFCHSKFRKFGCDGCLVG